MKIADASNGRCVARGISTMRLALGYKQALPHPIDYAPSSVQMVALMGECFPGRRVLLACDPPVIDGADFPSNVEYLGDHIDGLSHDKYLWCFSYVGEDETRAHLVIGSPEFHLRFHQVFAIELED